MKNIKLTGNVKIDVKDKGRNISLVFNFIPDGGLWDGDKFRNLLIEKGAAENFNSTEIEGILKGLVKPEQEAALTIMILGISPELSVQEVIEWEKKGIPENLIGKSEKKLKNAPLPEIYKINTGEEKTGKRERIKVNPKVIDTGWVKKGDKIGSVITAEDIKKGKNNIKIIARTPPAKSDLFYFGEGVEKEKNGIAALYSGFVSRGENWIEIISFQDHSWHISLSKDKSTCCLNFIPGGEDAAIPDTEAIIKEAVPLGFDRDTLIPVEKINAVISSSIDRKEPIENFPLCIDEDSFYKIDVSPDKLTGNLTIKKGRGHGKKLILKEVGKAIKESGFKGIDLNKIQKDILEFYKSTKIELTDYVLAKGITPKFAGDQKLTSSLTFLGKEEQEKIVKSSMDLGEEPFEGIESIKEFPLSAVGKMAYVKKDQGVAVISQEGEGEAGKDVFGKVIEPSGKEPDIKILENLKKGIGIITAEIDGILDKLEKDGIPVIRVRPHEDAIIEVKISSDRMSGTISLKKGEGTGIRLTQDEVNRVIAKSGIEKGIDSNILSEAIENSRKGLKIENILFAMGEQPDNPGSTRLGFKVELATGKGVTIDKTGKADYKNQDRITTVKKGAVIAEIISSDTKPDDGWDITGKTIAAKEAPALNLEVGENINEEKNNNGNIILTAAADGEIIYDGKKIGIKSVYTIKGNVDHKCGNINFPGSVYITGCVQSGFYIFAGGDLKIKEGVDASLLSADGMILVNQGIKGAGKAILRTKKEIKATFAEQASLFAVGDIKIKNACLRCNVKCNGGLFLTGDKGNIVGGIIRSRKGVTASNIGTESNVKTEISFGQDYLIADRIELEEREIQKNKKDIVKLDTMLFHLEKGSVKEKLDQVRKGKLKLLKMMEKRNLRLFNLREKFEEHFPSEIKISGTIFPGVVIESHGRSIEIKSKKEGVIIYFDFNKGNLQEKPIEK